MRAEHTTSGRWLNRFIWFLAALTLFLISSGGIVTSKGVGLAVPDWPTTFGYNMFLFPVSQWVGGIFYEHSHRLIASAVGFLTIILAVWLWRAEPRKWVRLLGVVALVAVIVQGVLGGLRVTMLKDEIGIFHACLAQAFLSLIVFIAVARSRAWELPARVRATSAPVWLATVTTVLIFVQLALGAAMRHQHRDLAILDFPLAYGEVIPDVSAERLAEINRWRDAQALSNVDASQIWLQMAHRFGAVLVTIGVVWFAWALRRTAAPARPLLTLSSFWVFFLALQVTLGAWTIWSNKAADIATAHVAVGATLLAIGVSIVAISRRLAALPPQSAILSRPPSVQEAHAL
jgi:heme a synthase